MESFDFARFAADYGLFVAALVAFIVFAAMGKIRWEREVKERDDRLAKLDAEVARQIDVVGSLTQTTRDAVQAFERALDKIEHLAPDPGLRKR